MLLERKSNLTIDITLSKLASKAVGVTRGAVLDAARAFLTGSRADVERNQEITESRRIQLERLGTSNRQGGCVLVPYYLAEEPLISFPLFWQVWSNWLPF